MSCQARYKRRQQFWKEDIKTFPLLAHHFWWLTHNCIAHPLLAFAPKKLSVRFHDWTAKYLNRYPQLRSSKEPTIPNWTKWAWHNIAGHILIGLFPCKLTFEFHDRTSKAMNVKYWV